MGLTRRQRREACRILIAGGLLALLGALALTGLLPEAWYLRLPLFLIPYLTVGLGVLRKAVLGIGHGQLLDENFLMAIATVGALVLGEYAEAVFVMLFYSVGELFQSVAVGKTRRSIASLMDIRPDVARVLRDGVAFEVDPGEVAVGELLEVRPGEKIPLDAVVVSGESDLNTLSLTGESLPRSVRPGDEVISGSVNVGGLLTLRVTKPFGESTVTKILELVESSALVKSRTETAVTKFAHWYTPLVVVCAVALAVIPSLISGDWQRWLKTALIFLVVSCPCALVISVPLSYFGGLGAASRRGVLVKGGNYLEALSRVETLVFDKTGTLTEGSFSVTEILPAEGVSEEALLRACLVAEAHSNHPIARSVKAACADRSIEAPVAERVTELPGKGVLAELAGETILVGNEALMREYAIEAKIPASIGTLVAVAHGGKYLGTLVISDSIKDGAAEALCALSSAGVKRTVMLTGDREPIARRVAETLGIDEFSAELLPDGKVREVTRLLEEEHTGALAFVGDGVNDAPVLARADVGIAMGALGSDAAIEAADVVLMDDDPRRIADAIAVARFTRRIVIENIVFALGVKAAFLMLGAFGLTNMWAATFADVGVAVIAILNAMRTLRLRTE